MKILINFVATFQNALIQTHKACKKKKKCCVFERTVKLRLDFFHKEEHHPTLYLQW